MSTHAASWLAWSLCALSLVLTGLGLLFHILNLSEPSVSTFTYWVESTLLGVGASTVGAIIASQRTHNPIGWLLCASGLVCGVAMFASEQSSRPSFAEGLRSSILRGVLCAIPRDTEGAWSFAACYSFYRRLGSKYTS
jgi:hypothetical protein